MSHDLDEMTEHPGSDDGQHSDPASESTRRRRLKTATVRPPYLLSLVVALIVAGTGLILTSQHSTTWSTHREVVIAPGMHTNLDQAAALYDSLSRGQVVATASEIFAQPRWHADAQGVTVTAGAIPPSAVVQVTATGTDARLVATTVDEVISSATAEVNATLAPYAVVTLGDGRAEPQPVGLSRAVLSAVAVLAGLLAGALTAGGVARLRGSRRG